MRRILPFLCLLALPLSAAGQESPSSAIAFTGINVVPMDADTILENHTIVVRDGRIAQLGPAGRVEPPPGTRTIDARGKFAIPGLAEMHGHLAGDDVSLNERILLLNVLYGVTTVRVMQGHPSHLPLRERVRRGELIGPHLYIAAPQLSGDSAPTPEVAVRLAREAKAQGFDLLKIQEGLSRPVFDAIVDTARELGIPFAGHVPAEVGLQRALAARMHSIDHLDGYLEALVPAGADVDLAKAGFFGSAIVDRIDPGKIPDLVRATKQAGTAVVPTQTLAINFLIPEPLDQLFARPELAYMPKRVVDRWRQQKRALMGQFGGMSAAQLERYYDVRERLIEALHEANVPVLLGSDAPQVLNVPGVAIHEELERMVQAGLTPYEALEIGTREVARHFGVLGESGTVAQGKRADLIVLEADPLEDIGNVRRRFGVMIGGRWLPREEIEARLEKLARDEES